MSGREGSGNDAMSGTPEQRRGRGLGRPPPGMPPKRSTSYSRQRWMPSSGGSRGMWDEGPFGDDMYQGSSGYESYLGMSDEEMYGDNMRQGSFGAGGSSMSGRRTRAGGMHRGPAGGWDDGMAMRDPYASGMQQGPYGRDDVGGMRRGRQSGYGSHMSMGGFSDFDTPMEGPYMGYSQGGRRGRGRGGGGGRGSGRGMPMGGSYGGDIRQDFAEDEGVPELSEADMRELQALADEINMSTSGARSRFATDNDGGNGMMGQGGRGPQQRRR